MTTFIHTSGTNLVDGNGEKFFIRGVNLGHWLNPEGYMFGFGRCNSPHFIDEMLRQLVGPEAAADFWTAFISILFVSRIRMHWRSRLKQLKRSSATCSPR